MNARAAAKWGNWCRLILGATGLLVALSAHGFPAGLAAFQARYPASQSDEHTSGGCALCHDSNTVVPGSGRWNAYGNALKRLIDAGTVATAGAGLPLVEGDNSDGDPGGASNLQEINASTQPGWKPGNGNNIYDAAGNVVLTNQPPPAEILPNLDLPSLTIDNPSIVEGNSGTVSLTFTATLSAASTDANVTVNYASSNGTATAGSDYTSVSSTLTFAPGVLAQPIVVTVAGDTIVEANETLFITLSTANNATLGTAQATGTILNDDVLASVAQAIPTLSEAALTITIALFSSCAGFVLWRRK